MTRTTFLVLAHRDPGLCVRLIDALACDSTRIVVHVDAAVDARPFASRRHNVAFVNRRVRVNRGGWSLTCAMMETLRTAFHETDGDYFVFLAGTDFPIKPCRHIQDYLSEKYPLNFINYFPVLEGTSGATNLTQYHFVDQSRWVARRLGLRADPEDRAIMFESWVRRLNEWLPARVFPSNLVPFRGSDRWCLNRDTVRHVLDCWTAAPWRRCKNYFRNTWGSDEMWFQTTIFNSPWARQCHLYDGDAVRAIVDGRRPPWPDEVKAYLHYIDWDVTREDPAVLDERDFDRLVGAPALFACKFDSHRSSGLLDMLEQRVLSAPAT